MGKDAVAENMQTGLSQDQEYSSVITGELPSSYHKCRRGRCYCPLDSAKEGIGTIHLTTKQSKQLGHHTGIGYKLELSVNGEASGPGQISGTLRKVKTQDGYLYMPDGDKTISWLRLDDAPDIVNYKLEVWAL